MIFRRRAILLLRTIIIILFFFNGDFNSTRENSAIPSSNRNSNCNEKGLPGEKSLLDEYVYECSPDKLIIEALKELNINDIRDFFMAGGPENTEQFEKEKRAPPPQYHLESSRGDVKERLTTYQLQSYFGGRHLKDFGLLSKLGTGISVIYSDREIPTIGELVNRKRGKHRRIGSKAVPLEVVGCDIG